MDKALIRARLAHAEQHIRLGERTIAQQHAIIASFKLGGLDTTLAEGTLRVFEQTQSARVADRDRILKALRITTPMTTTLFPD
jgi:hypothetical protein